MVFDPGLEPSEADRMTYRFQGSASWHE